MVRNTAACEARGNPGSPFGVPGEGEPQLAMMRAACVVTFVLTAGLARAQSPATADSLAAAGDTARAIEIYERALRGDRRNAELHYRVGRLYWGLAADDGAVSRDRRRAEEHLRYATRFAPDSARYWLGLAEIFRMARVSTMRVQWGSTVRKARELAITHGSPVLAEAEYQLGRMAWGAYERQGRRWVFPVGQPGILPEANDVNGWRELENMLETTLRELPGIEGEEDYRAAIEHLRAALRADPRSVQAAALLVVALGEYDQWEQALEVTRALVQDAPDSSDAWMTHGLALTRLERYEEAQVAQQRGLDLMPPAARMLYEDLSRILPRRDSTAWHAAPSRAREADRRLYWDVAQPLLLRSVNEVRAEYLARLTYADARWTEPSRDERGWETDRGAVYVRWGPPAIWGTLAADERRRDPGQILVLWVYPELELFFVFSGQLGYSHAGFAGEHQYQYETRANAHPVSFRNVPPLHRIDSAVVQIAQFRGQRGDTTELALFGFLPVGRMASNAAMPEVTLTSAAHVRDERFQPVAQRVDEERVQTGDSTHFETRSWRINVQPGQYVVRVEALSEELDRSARGAQAVLAQRFGRDSLQLSDVLVARRVAPRDSAPSSWHDFLIEPSVGRLAPGSSLGLLWEAYNLAPDASGIARYEVEVTVTVQSLLREGLGARVIGGVADALGLSARGDDELALRYEREARVTPGGRVVEYLMVDFEQAPSAEYEIRVRLTDRVSGQVAVAARQFAVDPKEPGTR